MNRTVNGVVAALLLGATTAAGAAASEGGEPGDAQQVSRTIEIVMHDNYFEPEQLSFAAAGMLLVADASALMISTTHGTTCCSR